MSTLASTSLKASLAAGHPASEFAADVRAGLTKAQKELHSKYLYDELGSALFEAITHLPEYGLTRADERLLQAHAGEAAERAGRPEMVIELGSGTGRKTRPILNALAHDGDLPRYYPIDVSSEALKRCRSELDDVASIHPIGHSYLIGLTLAAAARRRGEPILVLFLGSTIGNFEPPCALDFLSAVRRRLAPGDALLVGADLVKDTAKMLAAYDDPTGVTAAFNLNLLGRVNRELGANFDLTQFAHEARWNERERRIEMHLGARSDQTIEIPGARLTIEMRAGETIWTESSHKFGAAELFAMAERSGFEGVAQWSDAEWPFAESLWTAR